ncbi:MAG: hypothetical protein HKN08_05040, partial [Gammaproteobacteria bacterium]|nr:hypothetical protein [Gammaproteobacteria bacterium]
MANDIVYQRGVLPLGPTVGLAAESQGISIWTVDPDTLEPMHVRVTPDDTAFNIMPSWSPDRDKIVFGSNRGEAGVGLLPNLNIWTVNRDGSDLWQLTSDAGDNFTPSWSPNGRYIAFSSNRLYALNRGSFAEFEMYDLWIMGADGTNPRLLHAGPSVDDDPVFSADSQRILFRRNTADQIPEIWVVPTDGSMPAQPLKDVTGQTVVGEDPSLSEDGKTLYYWRDPFLVSFDLIAATETLLSPDALEPWIGPNKERFVFHRIDFSGGTRAPDVFISSLDGSNVNRITNTGDAMFGRWSAPAPQPFCEVQSNQAVYVTGEPIVLTSLRFANMNAVVAPDMRLRLQLLFGTLVVNNLLDLGPAMLPPGLDFNAGPLPLFTVQ